MSVAQTLLDVRGAITAANARFTSTFARGDAPGLALLYTEQGQVLPPGGDAISGRAGIQQFWQGAMDLGVKGAQLETVEADASGDTTCEVGRYRLFAEGGQEIDHGKYVVIWKQEGGEWRIHRDIWNSSIAPSPSA